MKELTEKDAREIQSYLKKINIYSALVERMLNKVVSGGVGTASKRQSAKAKKEAEIRAKFRK